MSKRLSEIDEEYVRGGVEAGIRVRPDYVALVLAELDAVRGECEDARRWAVRLEGMVAAERAAAYRLLIGRPVDIITGPEPEIDKDAVVVRVDLANWTVSSNEDGPYGNVDAEIAVTGGDGLRALVKLLESESSRIYIVGPQP